MIRIYLLKILLLWLPITASAIPMTGDTGPAGGKIFYVDPIKGFALEGSMSDQSPAFPIGQFWGCSGVNINTSTGIGDGEKNTAKIVSSGCAGPGTAAYLADTLIINGYDDWFLPSKEELDLMRDNLALLNLDYDHFHYSSSEYRGTDFSCDTSNNCVWVWENTFWYKTYTSPYGERVGVRSIRSFEFDAGIAPEPESFALLGIGLGLIFLRDSRIQGRDLKTEGIFFTPSAHGGQRTITTNYSKIYANAHTSGL